MLFSILKAGIGVGVWYGCSGVPCLASARLLRRFLSCLPARAFRARMMLSRPTCTFRTALRTAWSSAPIPMCGRGRGPVRWLSGSRTGPAPRTSFGSSRSASTWRRPTSAVRRSYAPFCAGPGRSPTRALPRRRSRHGFRPAWGAQPRSLHVRRGEMAHRAGANLPPAHLHSAGGQGRGEARRTGFPDERQGLGRSRAGHAARGDGRPLSGGELPGGRARLIRRFAVRHAA